MPIIVFTSPVLERPAAGGPQLRIENSIKALSRIADLHCIARVPAEQIGRPEDVDYLKGLCRSFAFAPSVSGLQTSRSFAARVYRKLCRPSPESLVAKDADYICRYVKRVGADVVWFGYGNISFPLIQRLRHLLPAAKLVCDTDSVWSRYILRELDVETDPARRLEIEQSGKAKEEEEKLNIRLSDVTTAVSPVDAEYFRSIAAQPERVHLFSNVIDLDSYQGVPAAPSGYATPALFLGGSFFPNGPMVHAANWVVNKVMPLVWEKHPQAHLYLVGRYSESTCAHLTDERVSATGRLPSVLPYLCNASCSLVPLFFESGTRFKILESGACGIPLVSTTLGAEGIPVSHMRDCLIADIPEDFARAICSLLDDPALGTRLASNCRELVRNQYSVETLSCEAVAILNYLLPPSEA